MTKIPIKISSIIVRYYFTLILHLLSAVQVPTASQVLPVSWAREEMLIVSPQINTDQPPSGNDWPILVTVFDENGAPHLSSRPFLFEDDCECERNVETCIRYGSGTDQMPRETLPH